MTDGGNRCPAEGGDGAEEYEWHNNVESAYRVGKEIWYDSAKDRSSVDDCEQVKSEILVGNAALDAVSGEVVEGDIHSHEAEEGTDTKQVVWNLAKDFEVE